MNTTKLRVRGCFHLPQFHFQRNQLERILGSKSVKRRQRRLVNGVVVWAVVSGGRKKAACACFGLTKNNGGGTRRPEIEPKEKKDRGWQWWWGSPVMWVDGGSRQLARDTGCCGGKLRDGEGEVGHAGRESRGRTRDSCREKRYIITTQIHPL